MSKAMKAIQQCIPGIALALLLGMSALLLSQHYSAPAMLFSLLLGLAMSFLYQHPRFTSGIEFTACHILRLGIALLGFRIVYRDLAALGWETALLLLTAIATTIVFGVILAKMLGLQRQLGVLTGGSVGICGASAAMAISAVLPNSKHKDRDTLLTIIGVTALSTLAMIIYPIIGGFLGLNETQISIFLGGTIHDVAQVVGAGYSVSEQAGDMATLTKLVRVALLMPVVLCILLIVRKRLSTSYEASKPGFPPFLLAFVLLMSLNSFVNLPHILIDLSSQLSRFALIMAIAAIGMKSNLKQLSEVGIKPIILIVAESAWIASVMLAGVWLYHS